MAGVYPVYGNKFKIATSGTTGESPTMSTIAEMETFSVSIDGNLVEWSPMEEGGWLKRFVTGKAITISISGKRCEGDVGNDYIAGISWMIGASCNSKFEWEFPSGATLTFNCVVQLTNPGGGGSRDLAGLEFDVMSNGQPTYTPADDS